MALARSRRGSGLVGPPPVPIASALDLRTEVRKLAELLEHNCRLALIAADSEEPEHGAEYLLDTLQDLSPRIIALRAKLNRRP
jgi:hypothetical protein